jgi:lysophospholipase L1-like esterase
VVTALLGLFVLPLLVACSPSAGEMRRLPADRQAPVVYVALGDSTVEGIGASSAEATYVGRLTARLRAVYPAARSVNLGVAGATSADVLEVQLHRAVQLAPDLVTLSVGPNDITGRVPVERYEANVRAILERLGRETRAVVVVNLIPDLAVTPRFRGRPEERAVAQATVAFNEALRRAARAHRAEVVDLYGPSREEVPRRPELIAGDGYHPSDAGYARWADLMWTGVQRRLGRSG